MKPKITIIKNLETLYSECLYIVMFSAYDSYKDYTTKAMGYGFMEPSHIYGYLRFGGVN